MLRSISSILQYPSSFKNNIFTNFNEKRAVYAEKANGIIIVLREVWMLSVQSKPPVTVLATEGSSLNMEGLLFGF